MTQFIITFQPQNITVNVDEGTTVLEAEIKAGLHPDSPCGGRGTCGKCTVNVLTGGKTGLQKACSTAVLSDMTVDLSSQNSGHMILTKGTKRNLLVNPMITPLAIELGKTVLGDSRSDWDRLKAVIAKTAGLAEAEILPNVQAASKLYPITTAKDHHATVMMCGKEILTIVPEQGRCYLMAFDIGTTSIVGYLLDGQDGTELALSSLLNPQSQYGADVIGRANYSLDHGLNKLSDSVQEALNILIGDVAKKASIKREDIYMASIVGNTCMHHLFLGISPASLVHAPYNPAISEPLLLNAAEYHIQINPCGKLMLLPNIAGFVGADTIGGLLATDFDRLTPLSLIIDIGTNGELVLGNKDRMIACSTAAGPAFEGAKIQCGMRGALGAIDHFSIEDNKVSFTTIGGGKPVGICGSGLMDIITVLLEQHIINESGKLLSPVNSSSPAAIANKYRFTEIDGIKSFVLSFEDESENQKKIYINQKDIREVQLAKGAMAAGISLMARKLGISLNEIEQVFIAGAFGNYMSAHSACAIGLIPAELEDRIIPIGNSAGEGAKIAVLNRDEFFRTRVLSRQVEFLELAAEPDFQDCFVDELEFYLFSD